MSYDIKEADLKPIPWFLSTQKYSRSGMAIEGEVPVVQIDSPFGGCRAVIVSQGASKERVARVANMINATPKLLAALEQIERLSREADYSLVDVPAMLGDISRNAIAEARGEA